MLELFRGNTYHQQNDGNLTNGSQDAFVRQQFDANKIIFSLASFNLDRTKEELFADNKMMKSIEQLHMVTDSLKRQGALERKALPNNIKPFYSYFNSAVPLKTRLADSTLIAEAKKQTVDKVDLSVPEANLNVLRIATNKARNIRSFTSSYTDRLRINQREINNYTIEVYRKYTQAAACLVMFLIGAPLGAIIKKGGFGVPVLIAILFFILFYIMTILGEKWGREGLVPVPAGMWAANSILLPIGFFFLVQARNDSRLLEFDSWKRIFTRFRR